LLLTRFLSLSLSSLLPHILPSSSHTYLSLPLVQVSWLYRFSEHGDIVEKLLELGGNPNAVDDEGNSAIFYAIRANLIPSFKLLIEHGAKVNLRNKKGETPLHFAVAGFGVEVFILELLRLGGDIHAISDDNISVFQSASPLPAHQLLKQAKQGFVVLNPSVTEATVTLTQAFPELLKVMNTEELIASATQMLSSVKEHVRLIPSDKDDLTDLETTLEGKQKSLLPATFKLFRPLFQTLRHFCHPSLQDFLRQERKNIPRTLKRNLTMSTMGPEKLRAYLDVWRTSTSLQFGAELWTKLPLRQPLPPVPSAMSKVNIGPPASFIDPKVLTDTSLVSETQIICHEGYPLGKTSSLSFPLPTRCGYSSYLCLLLIFLFFSHFRHYLLLCQFRC
jgi:hypothetical protein